MQKRTPARILALTLFGVVASASGVARAHFTLTAPLAAENDLGGGKGAPPCGPLTPASGVITAVQGGHPIMVSVSEFVQHTGHYRIALSVNSRSEIPADPVATLLANGNSDSVPIQNPPVFPILADGLFVHTQVPGGPTLTFSMMIPLPNITCAKCTLQVIEFMSDHGPNGFPGGTTFFYHHCADLKITADPNLPGVDAGTATDAGNGAAGGRTGTDAGTDARGAGGSTGAAGSTGNNGAGGSPTGVAGSTGNTGATGGTTGGNVAGSTGNNGTGGTATTTGTGGKSTNTDAGTTGAGDGGGCSSCMTAGRSIRFAPGGAALVLFGLLLALRRRRR